MRIIENDVVVLSGNTHYLYRVKELRQGKLLLAVLHENMRPAEKEDITVKSERVRCVIEGRRWVVANDGNKRAVDLNGAPICAICYNYATIADSKSCDGCVCCASEVWESFPEDFASTDETVKRYIAFFNNPDAEYQPKEKRHAS